MELWLGDFEAEVELRRGPLGDGGGDLDEVVERGGAVDEDGIGDDDSEAAGAGGGRVPGLEVGGPLVAGSQTGGGAVGRSARWRWRRSG